MTEETARKKIVAVCRHIISEWDSGRDWRWPTAGHQVKTMLEAIPLDHKWPDYRSLAAVWWFLFRISEAVTEGMSTFENLSWDEALGVIEESARRLEKSRSIEDPTVLHYLPPGRAAGCNPFAAILIMLHRI